jgi:hypothetical protein
MQNPTHAKNKISAEREKLRKLSNKDAEAAIALL